MNYTLEKSIRRTLSIQVKPTGEIIVKAPIFLPQYEIDKFVNQKESWIEKTLQKVYKRGILAESVKHNYQLGDKFFYLGKEYDLEFSDEHKQKVIFNEKFIIPEAVVKKGKPAVKKVLVNWYKQHAKDLFMQRLLIYSSNYSLVFNEMRLTSAKTRWGSCTSSKNIRLNWKLIMAPIEILDYVVVHELCHTVHPNHSKSFWKVVESIVPDWKAKRKWLHKNGIQLTV
jgi:predicted metal-dependent hydrolase